MSYKSKYKQAHSRKDLKPNKPMKSWKTDKKMVVLAKMGNTEKVIHFGQVGYEDYTMHKDPARRRNYLARTSGINDKFGLPTKNNIFSANYWARKILW